MGYVMSISMCMQNFITIFHSVLEISPFSLFQYLELGKASTDEKCHFAISWARSCLYQSLCKMFIQLFHSVQEIGLFSLFQNLNLGNASANPKWHLNDIWQSIGLLLVNINAYAKFYQNIPNGLRVVDIFHEKNGDKIFTNSPRTKSSKNCPVTNYQMFDYRAL